MEIKDIIRKKREELNLTYEQLGNIVGVGKSTVRKWETGMIENMRRDNIVALAKALNISPAVIMGLENDTVETNEKNITLSKEETTLLENYNKLNVIGKKEANKRVAELTEINKYTDAADEISATTDNVIKQDTPKEQKDDDEVFVPYTSLDQFEYCNAAHDDDLTDEEKVLFDKISLDAINKKELEKFNARKKNK